MAFPAYTPTPTRLVTLSRADGSEKLRASTTNVSLEQLADGIAWLDQSKQETFVHGGSGSPTSDLYSWTSAPSGPEDYQDSGVYLDVTGCALGDTFVVTMSGNFESDNSTTGYNRVRLIAIDDVAGTPLYDTMHGTIDLFAQSEADLDPQPATPDGVNIVHHPGVSLTVRHVVAGAGTTRFMVQASLDVGASNQLDMKGGYAIVATRTRA
jgi:hypothetical protein